MGAAPPSLSLGPRIPGGRVVSDQRTNGTRVNIGDRAPVAATRVFSLRHIPSPHCGPCPQLAPHALSKDGGRVDLAHLLLAAWLVGEGL